MNTTERVGRMAIAVLATHVADRIETLIASGVFDTDLPNHGSLRRARSTCQDAANVVRVGPHLGATSRMSALSLTGTALWAVGQAPDLMPEDPANASAWRIVDAIFQVEQAVRNLFLLEQWIDSADDAEALAEGQQAARSWSRARECVARIEEFLDRPK